MQPTLSVLGLYQYDSTIFDLWHIPEGVDRQVLIDLTIAQAVELEVVYPNTTIFKTMLGRWSASRVYAWSRIHAALSAEYSPIENFDRYEDISEEYSRDLHQTGTGSATEQKAAFNAPSMVDTGANSSTGMTDLTDGENRTVSNHLHGNIGVTTNQQMIHQELELRKTDIYQQIVDDFVDNFCVGVF